MSAQASSTAGGASLTITGTNFASVSAVTFGGVSAGYTVNSLTQMTVAVPAHAAGVVDVLVTTSSGTSAVSTADQFGYVDQLAVTGLSVSSGSANGGTVVAISGSKLNTVSAVLFGTVPAASFTINSDGTITAVSPSHSAGTVDVTVESDSTSSAPTGADRYEFAVPPTVAGLSSSSGPAFGGNQVTISGIGFADVAQVVFGTVAATQFLVKSSTSITVLVPSQTAQTVDVSVVNHGGASAVTVADRYTYTSVVATVSALSVVAGPVFGGTAVTITGSNLNQVTEVDFGSKPANGFWISSPTSITAYAPLHTAGTVDVTVKSPYGNSSTSASDQFTFLNPPPVVMGLSTSAGGLSGGQAVTISGTGFSQATSVFFGSIPANSFTINSDSSITAAAPSETKGNVNVTVSNGAATSAISPADHFSFTDAPLVTGLSVPSGSLTGGEVITITGSNFTSASAVNFGNLPAQGFVVNSSSLITAVVPANLSAGVNVTVTTPGGTSAGSSADQYSAASKVPSISGLSASSVSTLGGDLVTITGTNLDQVTAVNFGGVAASGFHVNGPTSITAFSPVGATGTVDIRVQSAAGISAASANDQVAIQNPAPTINGLSIAFGSSAGGGTVTITGTNLNFVTAVDFGGVPANAFWATGFNSLLAYVPAATGGTVDVTLKSPYGMSTTSAADRFQYTDPTPIITGVTSAFDASTGMTAYTIAGTNLDQTTGLTFGSTAALAYWVNSPTSVTAYAPASVSGTADVSIGSNYGTSPISSADQINFGAGSSSQGNTSASGGSSNSPNSSSGGSSSTLDDEFQASLDQAEQQIETAGQTQTNSDNNAFDSFAEQVQTAEANAASSDQSAVSQLNSTVQQVPPQQDSSNQQDADQFSSTAVQAVQQQMQGDQSSIDGYSSSEQTAANQNTSDDQQAQQTYSTSSTQASTAKTTSDQGANSAFDQVYAAAVATFNASIASAQQDYGNAIGSPGAIPQLPTFSNEQLGLPDAYTWMMQNEMAYHNVYDSLMNQATQTYDAAVAQANESSTASNLASSQQYSQTVAQAQSAYDNAVAVANAELGAANQSSATAYAQANAAALATLMQAFQTDEQNNITAIAGANSAEMTTLISDAQTAASTVNGARQSDQRSILQDLQTFDSSEATNEATFLSALQNSASSSDILSAFVSFVEAESGAATSEGNSDSQAENQYEQAVNGAASQQTTGDANAADQLTHGQDTAASEKASADAQAIDAYYQAIDQAKLNRTNSDADASAANTQAIDQAGESLVTANEDASNALTHSQDAAREQLSEALAQATEDQTNAIAAVPSAASQAVQSYSTQYSSAYQQALAAVPNSGPLVAFYIAANSASTQFYQAINPALMERTTTLSSDQYQFDTSTAQALQPYSDSLSDNYKTYVTTVVPQLQQTFDTLATDDKTSTESIAGATQQADDQIAGNAQTATTTISTAVQTASDTIADNTKQAVQTESTAALAMLNQVSNDANTVRLAVNNAINTAINTDGADALAAQGNNNGSGPQTNGGTPTVNQLTAAQTMSAFALAAYQDQVLPQNLQAAGWYTPKGGITTDAASGFRAVLFVKDHPLQAVLAFGGTNPWHLFSDVLTDVDQGLGWKAVQYTKAIDLAENTSNITEQICN